mmetsp:Transcript_18571/g.30806  ORF Transcript_18571/g.30806 Transcript_18571/m.30806 type:complete len:415 (-) Transcript_18571:923-2167(-)
MVLYIKPATALLALLTGDTFHLTVAERSRREQLLAGESTAKKERIPNLVLDAEFRRAMLANSAADAPRQRLLSRSSGSGSAREKFAQQPRIQRMLANIRRKRALTGTVKRSVIDKPGNAEEADVQEDEEVMSLVECSLDTGAYVDLANAKNDGADVGLLGYEPDEQLSGCDDGYACVPSDASDLGGLCTPTATMATHRVLQGYTSCLAGCPVEVCECYETQGLFYGTESALCIDALINACRVGSNIKYCAPSDKLEQAFAQAYCDAHLCFAENGLPLPETEAVNISCDMTDSGCAECYCTLYSSLCNNFRPICEQGTEQELNPYTVYMCNNVVDYVCDFAECCDGLGPAGFAECCDEDGPTVCMRIDGTDSYMPTPDPTLPPSGASDRVLPMGGGRCGLLGASVFAAGIAQTLI